MMDDSEWLDKVQVEWDQSLRSIYCLRYSMYIPSKRNKVNLQCSSYGENYRLKNAMEPNARIPRSTRE